MDTLRITSTSYSTIFLQDKKLKIQEKLRFNGAMIQLQYTTKLPTWRSDAEVPFASHFRFLKVDVRSLWHTLCMVLIA